MTGISYKNRQAIRLSCVCQCLKVMLILFILSFTEVSPKELRKNRLTEKKSADANFENEDLLMELSISELQREILQEKLDVLNSEIIELNPLLYPNSDPEKKKIRFRQNIIFPGLGTWNFGEKTKGSLTMASFSFLTLAFFGSYQKTAALRRDIDRLPYYEYTEQSRLTADYKAGIHRTNLLLAGSAFIYVLNIFESNEWEWKIPKDSGQNGNQSFLMDTYASPLEKSFLFSVQIPFDFAGVH